MEDVLDLSASLNPLASDVTAVVAGAAGAARRYPDATAATAALAATLGVEEARVVLTNGGSEAIALVAALERQGEVVDPEFSLYRRHLDEVVHGAPRWRSNPSNPLGALAPLDATARVWDEAFFPLAAGRWTRGDEDAWRIGSLTKVWACPGLRVGYAVAPDAASAARLVACQPRWAVNGLAVAAIEALLPASDPAAWTAQIRRLRAALVEVLAAHRLTAEAADAPWVLVHRPGLRDALAQQGIVVRDCASFGLPEVFRVAVPDDEGRARLSDALDEVLA